MSNQPSQRRPQKTDAPGGAKTLRCLIMGAAGRDFHDFQTFFRNHPEMHVCAFTAAQIPYIENRFFPRTLAGDLYKADIPIFPEAELENLVRRYAIDFVFLSYSDLSFEQVMHKASRVQACGASFCLLGPEHTQLRSTKPVVAVTAVRTGAGKSPLSRWLAEQFQLKGYTVGIIRHPMPYGDLRRQAVERLVSHQDLERFECTVEEREEYEPYVERGMAVYAGVNYERILALAESDSDVILWDGGNNDFSFVRPDLSIVVADALRAGHETLYYPGETNLRMADVLVINKVGQARSEDVSSIRAAADELNPQAIVVEADLEITMEKPESIQGRRVLVVEDGPTLTHGGMAYGAGTLAVSQGAAEVIDPRPFAEGSIAQAYDAYPHIGPVLPALGYSPEQRRELGETIRKCSPDVIVDASPARLDRVLQLDSPVVRVDYSFRQVAGPSLWPLVEERVRLAGRLAPKIPGERIDE